jgi:parvulin-like peptidyl-prolyl isomerase
MTHQTQWIVVALLFHFATPIATLCAGDTPIFIASVDGEPIYLHEVRRQASAAVDLDRLPADVREQTLELALGQLINQRLVQRRLDREKLSTTEAEVSLQVEQLKTDLTARMKTWDDYLRLHGMTDQEMRRQLRWQTSWQRHVDRQLTEEALQKYFDARRRDFDGTRLHVRQILLKVDDEQNRSQALDRAEKLRKEIADARISFAQAAARDSIAPSAAAGGDQGWITRRGEYPESFSRAAFALNTGEISPPTESRFGVHLIQCVEIEQGAKTLGDVLDDVRTSAAAALFHEMAAAELPGAKVRRHPVNQPPP